MDDLISRQAAIDCEYQVKIINDIEYVMLSEVQMKMRKLPSAEPERKKGTWIHQTKFGRIECDQCGKVYRNSFTQKNFCPNCGADMRGKDDNN